MAIKFLAKNEGTAEILIHEEIGENWFGDGLTSKRFAQDLAKLGDVSNITVRINSPGGSVTDGVAIYNALKTHRANVEVIVEGMAASIASIIAMAGNTIRMRTGAMMMVHAPWTVAIGNADDMREMADALDKFEDSLLDIYEERTKRKRSDLKNMLKVDTWMTSTEAVTNGFADVADQDEEKTEESLEALSTSIARFDDFVRNFRAKSQKLPVSQIAAALKPAAVTKQVVSKSEVSAVDEEQLKAKAAADAAKAQEARMSGIRQVFSQFPQHQSLMVDCLTDVNCTVDQARAKLLDKMGSEAQPHGSVVNVQDAADKFRTGAVLALCERGDVRDEQGKRIVLDRGNEFRGLSVLDIGAQALKLAGINVRGLTKRELASRIMAAHSSSDFPQLLANVAGKALQAAYATFPRTWNLWCGTRPVSDFKQVKNLRLGTFSSLLEIKEGSEYKGGVISEEGESNQAKTKGRKINFTRQMLINDDLGAFTGFATKMGQAAARTVNKDAYAVLIANAALSDTVALFHATHGNLGSGAITVANLSAGKTAMRKQKDKDSNETLDIQPAYILVPVAKEDTAREVITASTKDAQSNAAVPNVLQNFVQVISDPELDVASTSVWYLVANPSIAELVQAVFLDGNQTPFIDEQIDFDTDSMDMKVRLDYGFAANEYKAGYKSTGV